MNLSLQYQDAWWVFHRVKYSSCKKSMRPQKAWVKKDVKSKMAAKNGCDNSSMAKILIMTIQVNLCVLLQDSVPNSPEFSLLKFLPLNYYHSGLHL